MDEDEDEDDFVDDDNRPELPPIAGSMTKHGFEPDDNWLRGASWKLRHEAMRQWFFTRFEDPAQNTPYNGAEGGYLYIHGGPRSAEDELYKRFGSVVEDPDEYIRRVIDDVESDGITDWAAIQHEREDENEWLNTDVPPNPLEVFMDSYHHVGDILAEYGEGSRGILSHSGQLINRMVFVQQVSALEAYLGDTLANQVLSKPDAMHALLEGDKDLQELKLPLVVFSKNPGIILAKVKEYLQGVLYHNLAKVAVLYKLALGIDIWPDNQTKNDLFVAISRRHDYVHRNGKDKDGIPLQKMTRNDVSAVLETMRRTVDHIEAQCRDL
jgi:hypothetical protein